MFEDIEWTDLLYIDNYFTSEVGWSILMLICKNIIPSYQFLIIITSLINTLLLANFAKQWHLNIAFVLAIFVAFDGFEIMINLLRNSIATLICLNALTLIAQRKFIPYVLICMFAACFHISALFYIPLFFINIKFRKPIYIAFFLCAIGTIFFPTAIRPILEQYTSADFSPLQKMANYVDFDVNSLSHFELFIPIIFGVIFITQYNTIISRYPSASIFLNSLLIYIVIKYCLIDIPALSTRLCMLFAFSFYALCEPTIRLIAQQNKLNSTMICYFIAFMLFFKVYVCTANQPIKEYQSYILNNVNSYEKQVNIFESASD